MTESRGVCPSCGRVMQVRLRDGCMRQHRSAIRGEWCAGEGKVPLPMPVGTHVVYRCFDRHGRLLYIGSTQALTDRMWHHSLHRPELMQHLFHVAVEHHQSRQAAMAAERAAIGAEAPILNKVHNRGRGVDVVPPFEQEAAA